MSPKSWTLEEWIRQYPNTVTTVVLSTGLELEVEHDSLKYRGDAVLFNSKLDDVKVQHWLVRTSEIIAIRSFDSGVGYASRRSARKFIP